jgi:cell wall-associated NlpC family hydrolase
MQVFPDESSFLAFESTLAAGDLLVWPNNHAAFYVGNDGLFEAYHYAPPRQGGTTGFSWNDLLGIYLRSFGYPNVYQETGTGR